MQTLVRSLTTLPPASLHAAAMKWGLQLNRTRYRLAALLLAVDQCRMYEAHGSSSTVQYAVNNLQLEGHVAAELLRAARALEQLPAIAAAFAEGLLPWSKVRE